MFCPFWFKIVSIAIAVLPVWRSPIINSRWPLPIGMIASIDVIPVCNGWSTDFLVMTPLATRSIGLVLPVLISPWPSIACPNGLTTLPNISSPTGTSIILPVRLTSSPSLIVLSDPSSTAPTLSSSKFMTIP